jgi:hypothetical protein
MNVALTGNGAPGVTALGALSDDAPPTSYARALVVDSTTPVTVDSSRGTEKRSKRLNMQFVHPD